MKERIKIIGTNNGITAAKDAAGRDVYVLSDDLGDVGDCAAVDERGIICEVDASYFEVASDYSGD